MKFFFFLVFLPETSGKNLSEICEKYSYGWRNSLFVAVSPKRDSIAIEAHRINSSNQTEQANSNV